MTDPYLITTDILTTIDRYPSYPTRGEKVLEFVALWDEPGANKYDTKNLTGALSPGTEVTILEYCVVDYVLWVRVEAEQGGRNQAGWCNAMFLDKVGALYLETMAKV